MNRSPSRRRVLASLAAAVGAGALSACDRVSGNPWFRRNVLHAEEDANRAVQRFFLRPTSMAREFPASAISDHFRANGSTDPSDPDYRAMAANGFADWKLTVGGLVETPLSLSLADLRAMKSRTQITRHDCVEGWSCIGKWTGVPLAEVLQRARLNPDARYIVFLCADNLGGSLDGSGLYYESLALEDAAHPQTILAYDMNDAPLTVPHGAPLRLRVERQLGYKMAKYVMTIQAVADFDSFRGGNGGYWEDRGYDWYAGI